MPTQDAQRQIIHILVSDISPNPENPRGDEVRERDPQFELLRSSVRENGILVPLIVTPRKGGGYMLVDGERRWHVARSLRIESVPAYVLEERIDNTELQELMFHIHMNRLQWDAATQCAATEAIYRNLVTEYGEDLSAIQSAYQKHTGMDARTARDRLRFLRWPHQVKESVYESHSGYGYAVEIEDKIVEPALQNYPEYFTRVPVDDVRRFLFEKIRQSGGTALDVRQARRVTRSKFEDPPDREQVFHILDRLVKDPDFSFADADEEFVSAFPESAEPEPVSAARMLTLLGNLAGDLERFDPELLREDAPYTRRVDCAAFESALQRLITASQELLQAIP